MLANAPTTGQRVTWYANDLGWLTSRTIGPAVGARDTDVCRDGTGSTYTVRTTKLHDNPKQGPST